MVGFNKVDTGFQEYLANFIKVLIILRIPEGRRFFNKRREVSYCLLLHDNLK